VVSRIGFMNSSPASGEYSSTLDRAQPLGQRADAGAERVGIADVDGDEFRRDSPPRSGRSPALQLRRVAGDQPDAHPLAPEAARHREGPGSAPLRRSLPTSLLPSTTPARLRYSSSLTCSPQVTRLPDSSASWIAMWVTKRSGAAPCQWFSAGLEPDPVAGPDLLDRGALALAEPEALGDEDRLAERVGVPGGAGAGREVDGGGGGGGRRRRHGDGVDVDVAAEPVGRPFTVAGEFLVICIRVSPRGLNRCRPRVSLFPWEVRCCWWGRGLAGRRRVVVAFAASVVTLSTESEG